MKRTFWTRNLFIGVLMGLVMVLGVQESADALTFGTTRRGDLATKGIGDEFTITFSVTLGGNTTAARNNAGQLISAPSAGGAGVRIDSSGYPVTDITVGGRSREYRNFGTQPTVPAGGAFVIDPRPRLSDAGTAGNPGATYYISGSNIVDSNGQTVYVQTGGGTADNPWLYTTARSSLGVPAAQINNADRYHYNDERVSITASNASIIKVGSTSITPIAADTALVLRETLADSTDARANTDAGTKLTSSVTLTLRATAAAVVGIAITDATPEADRPGNPAPQQDFTVYVVSPQSAVSASGTTTFTSPGDGVEYAYEGERRQINTYFTFVPAANAPVHYSVEGSGRVYVWLSNSRRTSATNSLFTSSSAPVYLDTNRGTSKVTVWISGTPARSAIFIFQGASPNKFTRMAITQGDGQTGATGGRLEDYLEVKVTDGNNRPIPGVAVQFSDTPTDSLFIPVSGTKVYVTTADALETTVADIDSLNGATFTATASKPAPANTIFVQTDRSGLAKVYYQLSATGGDYQVTAGLTGSPTTVSQTFRPTATTGTRKASLAIVSGNGQSAAKGEPLENPLVVIARSTAGHRIAGVSIEFETTTGLLESGSASGQEITVETGSDGTASATYNVGQITGARSVTAEVTDEQTTATEYDFVIERVEFRINGSSTRPPTDPTPPAAPTNRINISLSSSTGEPGDEITVTVQSDPTGRTVRLTSDDFADSLFSPQSGTTLFESTLTLPDEDGEYTITAEGFPLEAASATVTVETGILGRITISQIGQPSGGAQNFSIGVVDTDGDRISGALTVRVSGSGFTTRNIETLDGFGNARLTLPTTAGLYTLTASAEDYTPGTTQVRIAAPEPPQDTADEEEEEEEEAPEPASIEISGPSTRTGTANTAIEAALLVQVLDDDDDAVEDARVIFRVRTGQGRLSQRGNGRAVAVQTDSRGYARAEYTPISASSTVEAEVRGVRTPVTFTITATDAAPSTDTPDTGEDTPPDTIRPTVHTPAAQRPPMLWVAGGKIYSLVGTDVHEFAPNLNNVMNITIGGGKVYWTAKTSASSGTINAANLDGSGVKELKSIMAIPIGIAVDTTNSLLYWTNSRGRIQSANLDGSGIRNVMQNIRNPNDLALAGGNVYWTESNHGSVRFVNLRGQKQVRVISTGDDPAGSLAIAGGKVYWTEKVGENGGTINSANLNGSGATELASILATPIGIAVDTARSKLYWTNARGRIQSASLSGSSIRNVVGGLESPGEIVLSNSIKVPTTTAAKSTITAAGKNKYDINGDGKVDSTDTGLVVLAISTGDTSAKLDVNGDGKVNFSDYVLVSENVDAGAAGAPSVFGMKMSAAQIERLQEQIELLIASGDRSPAAMRALIYFQQLIATARPEKTQLLANYPNPFNPETWMPYELATDTDVRITIYNAQGVVIRTLQLGQQSAGYYTDRERAAYWDGRNAFGERVASGVYFYQLETDDMSSLRKMVILK